MDYNGQVKSYSKLTGFWKVQYHDGEKEEFDQTDMVHYVIRGKLEPVPAGQEKKRGHEAVTTVGRADGSQKPEGADARSVDGTEEPDEVGAKGGGAGDSDLPTESGGVKLRRGADSIAPQKAFYVSVRGDNMQKVLKQLGMRSEFAKTYCKYLPKEFLATHWDTEQKDFLYNQHKRAFKIGTVFPRPNDSRWFDMLRSFRARQAALHPPWKTAQDVNEALQLEHTLMHLNRKVGIEREGRHAYYARQALATVLFKSKVDREKSFRVLDTVETLVRIAANAAIVIPKVTTIWDGLASDHAKAWVDVLLEEDAKLDALGVFVHNVPKDILRAVGITDQFIVPSRYVPQAKHLPTGEFDRPNTRKEIQGHKYAMKKNTHYDRTFAATPSLDSSRILEGYSIGNALFRFTFDIVSAYQHAPHEGPPLGVK
jgi:hypothetical protein